MNTALFHRHKPLGDCADHLPETTGSLFQRIKTTLKVWHWRHQARARLRVELQVMDVVRIEKDTGLPTGALRQEAHKPFWKA